MNFIVIAGIGFGLIVVVLVGVFVVINMDLSSYTATGSETLAPAGTPVGRALVVYSPGFSGAAKDAAAKIARDLAAKGYAVDLAGVRSATASKGAVYDVVVAGGPMYFGKVSASVGDYLKASMLRGDARLGVFGTTGTGQYVESDFKSLTDQVVSLAGGDSFHGNTAIKLILTGSETDANCADLVSAVLQ
jgi:hypothetical protein